MKKKDPNLKYAYEFDEGDYKNDIYYRLLKRHIQILICITRLYLIIETFNS